MLNDTLFLALLAFGGLLTILISMCVFGSERAPLVAEVNARNKMASRARPVSPRKLPHLANRFSHSLSIMPKGEF
jgi:hypothetical protein